MLKFNTAATFELVPRAAAASDVPGKVYPHMIGNLNREYLLEGHYVINEITGQKYLRVVVRDDAEHVVCEGRLFRDTTVYGRPQYTGYLRIEEASPDGQTRQSWQIELSAELGPVGLSSRNSRLWGRAYSLEDAAEYSFNNILKESGIAF